MPLLRPTQQTAFRCNSGNDCLDQCSRVWTVRRRLLTTSFAESAVQPATDRPSERCSALQSSLQRKRCYCWVLCGICALATFTEETERQALTAFFASSSPCSGRRRLYGLRSLPHRLCCTLSSRLISMSLESTQFPVPHWTGPASLKTLPITCDKRVIGVGPARPLHGHGHPTGVSVRLEAYFAFPRWPTRSPRF